VDKINTGLFNIMVNGTGRNADGKTDASFKILSQVNDQGTYTFSQMSNMEERTKTYTVSYLPVDCVFNNLDN
jgi:hypothetical protein